MHYNSVLKKPQQWVWHADTMSSNLTCRDDFRTLNKYLDRIYCGEEIQSLFHMRKETNTGTP